MFSECFFFCACRYFLTKIILDKPLKVSAILIVCSDVLGKSIIAYHVILKTFAKKVKINRSATFYCEDCTVTVASSFYYKYYYTDRVYQASSVQVVSEYFAYHSSE